MLFIRSLQKFLRLCFFTLACHIEPFHSSDHFHDDNLTYNETSLISLNQVLINNLISTTNQCSYSFCIILYFSCKLKYLTEFNKIKIVLACFNQNDVLTFTDSQFREFLISIYQYSI